MATTRHSITVNGEPVLSHVNHAGECHVSISDIDLDETTTIKAYLYNPHDVMCLLLTRDAIARKTMETGLETEIHLTLPFLPYTALDYWDGNGGAYGARVITWLINTLNCTTVTLFDPHSKMIEDLLPTGVFISQADIFDMTGLSELIENGVTPVPFFNDPDSVEKVTEIAERAGVEPLLDKEDVVEGEDYIVVADRYSEIYHVIAKHLKDRGANNVYLYSTFGDFLGDLGLLKETVEHVYCFCTLGKEYDEEFLTVLEDTL